MSQSAIVKRKSSPCCIGCVIVAIVAVGLVAAVGIWGYRFYKDNIGLHDVAAIPDPPLDVQAEVMFPETLGKFSRQALNDDTSQIPGLADLATTSAITATYADPAENFIHAVALPTDEAMSMRQQQAGPLTMGRGKANAPDIAISIKNPVDKNSTTLTWSKPNWTMMFYTTSTVVADFFDAYAASKSTTAIDSETTAPATSVTTGEEPAATADETAAETPAPVTATLAATPEAAAPETTTPVAQ